MLTDGRIANGAIKQQSYGLLRFSAGIFDRWTRSQATLTAQMEVLANLSALVSCPSWHRWFAWMVSEPSGQRRVRVTDSVVSEEVSTVRIRNC